VRPKDFALEDLSLDLLPTQSPSNASQEEEISESRQYRM
jgi:hypothetical protein